MAINDVPQKFFARLNNSLKSGDFSLVLDSFTPTAVLEYKMIGPQKFINPELIVDGLRSMIKKGANFVISTPASASNKVAINFDLYGSGPQKIPGTVVFTVNEKEKITHLLFEPGYNRTAG
jgi:hypothetical protein